MNLIIHGWFLRCKQCLLFYFVVNEPIYAQCSFGKVDTHDDDDNKYTMGEKEWAPSYVYYTYANNDSAPIIEESAVRNEGAQGQVCPSQVQAYMQ